MIEEDTLVKPYSNNHIWVELGKGKYMVVCSLNQKINKFMMDPLPLGGRNQIGRGIRSDREIA